MYSKRFANRVQELKEVKSALNIIETKIKFTYEPLPEIFKQMPENLQQNIGEIFINTNKKMNLQSTKEAWESSVEESKTSLNKEDKNIIKKLGNMLR
jgi:stage III sporulation protein AB